MLAFCRTIMRGSANPLKDFPAVTRFQMVPLLVHGSTTIFVTGKGAWLWFGPLVVVLLVAGRLVVNRVTFEHVRIVKNRREDPVEVRFTLRRRLARVNSPAFLIYEGAW